jgi:hypothetical protein
MSVYALDPQKISSSITCNNVLTGLLLIEPFNYVHKQYRSSTVTCQWQLHWPIYIVCTL